MRFTLQVAAVTEFEKILVRPGELPPLRRKYIIRVLIPCYKESLAITQRTVLAARRADRPAGTRVIIYICDDGGDSSKSDWV